MSKFPVRLIVSHRMTNRGGEEHSLIRLAQRAREHFEFGKDQLILTSNTENLKLTIRQAYREDMKMVPENDRISTGFITEDNYVKLMGKQRKEDFWLTEDDKPIMIGCDPEFIIEDKDGKLVSVGRLIPRFDKFGADADLAEIRPDPSQNVDEVISNIENLLRNPPSRVEEFNWRAGAYWHERCIGGHIHIGTPEELFVRDSLGSNDPNLKLHLSLTMLLDDCITVPMTRIDGPDAVMRRQHPTGYGRYRNARYDEGRLEWRTPSGFWLAHPKIARAVLGTTKALAECYWQRLPAKNREKVLNPDEKTAHENGILSNFGIRVATKTREIIWNNKATKKEVDSSLKLLKNIETYSEYRSYIDDFGDIVTMQEEDSKKIGYDIKANWY